MTERPQWALSSHLTVSKADRRADALSTSLRLSLEKCEHPILDTLHSKPYGHFAGGTAIRPAARAGSASGIKYDAWRHSRQSLPAGGNLSRARRLDACLQQAGKLQHPPYAKNSRRIGHNRVVSVDSPPNVHVSAIRWRRAGVDIQHFHRVGHVVSTGNCPTQEINARRALDVRETPRVCRLLASDQTLFALGFFKGIGTQHACYSSSSVLSSGCPP